MARRTRHAVTLLPGGLDFFRLEDNAVIGALAGFEHEGAELTPAFRWNPFFRQLQRTLENEATVFDVALDAAFIEVPLAGERLGHVFDLPAVGDYGLQMESRSGWKANLLSEFARRKR